MFPGRWGARHGHSPKDEEALVIGEGKRKLLALDRNAALVVVRECELSPDARPGHVVQRQFGRVESVWGGGRWRWRGGVCVGAGLPTRGSCAMSSGPISLLASSGYSNASCGLILPIGGTCAGTAAGEEVVGKREKSEREDTDTVTPGTTSSSTESGAGPSRM